MHVGDQTSVGEPVGENDVLFGRGGINLHPGNIRFRDEATRLHPEYESTSKEEKYPISILLIDFIEQTGGRCLEREPDGLWYEVDRNMASKKASQKLRQD